MLKKDLENSKRVVITGMGMVSSLGNNLKTSWDNMILGKCGIRTIDHFDTTDFKCRIAGKVQNFDPLEYMEPRDIKRMSSCVHLAVAATGEALKNSGLDLDQMNLTRVGVDIGTAFGGIDVVEEQKEQMLNKGARGVRAYTIPAMLHSMPSCFISIKHKLQGPVGCSVAACTTGVVSIGEGVKRILNNEADVMIVGGTESAITPLILNSFGRMGALSTKNSTPQKSLTPFDSQRDGTVLGDGSGIIILESLEFAQKRNAVILAEVSGYGLTGDAHHISSPVEDGSGGFRAMSIALEGANIDSSEIDYIGAHGTGTKLNDSMETRAIKMTFGKNAGNIPISSIKSMTGHTLGASGVISSIAAVRTINEKIAPATINLCNNDPQCDLDYIPNKSRELERVRHAIVNSFGFGGQNGSIIYSKYN